jgi:hypothetical protein
VSEIRSVTVRLKADVTEYRRRMREAGRDTELAFQRSQAAAQRADADFARVSRSSEAYATQTRQTRAEVQGLTSAQRQLSTATARQATRVDRLTQSNRDLESVVRRVNQQMGNFNGGSGGPGGGAAGASQNTQTLSRQFDRASGRARLLVDAIVAIGPAAVPIGAVAVPAVTGLANQLGIAVLAAGSLVVAFQGIGDSIKALNEYDLDPSIDNLAKVHEEFSKIGPDARAAAVQISELRDEWARLKNTAAAGFFRPIMGELDNADVLIGRVEDLLFAYSRAAGLELSMGLDSLGSDRWHEFVEFLAREAQPTLRDLSQIIGNTAHAMSNMWMAFQPLNRDFGDWLVDVTRRWDEWSETIEDNQSVQDFIDYIYNNGPEVAEALGAVGGALVDIVTAAAPLGGPTLQILEAIADVIGAIAASNIGTPLLAAAAAMTIMNRSGMLLTSTLGRVTGAQGFATIPAAARQANAGIRSVASNVGILATGWATAGARSQREAARMAQASASLRQTGRNIAAPAAALAGLGLAATGAANGMGLTNTISLGLMGTIAGPWGAAIGAGVGLLMDLSAASDAAAEAQRRVEQAAQGLAGTLDPATGAVTGQTRELLKQIIAAEGVDDTLQNLGYTSEQMVSIITGQSDGYTEMYSRLLDVGGAGKEAAELLGLLSNEMADARDDQISLAEAAGVTTEQYDRAARAIDGMAESYKAWSDTLTAFDAETAVGAALQSLRETFRQTGEDLDTMTESGQAFRSALSEWSSATQELIDTTPITQQGFVLEQQVARLAEEMGVSIDTAWRWANEVGVSAQTVSSAVAGASAQLELLGGKFLSLPSEVITEIATYGIPQTEAQVDALVAKYDLTEGTRTTLMAVMSEAAELQISGYRQMLNAIPSSVRTKLIIEELRSRAAPAPTSNWMNQYTPPMARADGGYISGPGGPRDDAIPALLSNGEYVVKASATARYRPVLEAINAGRYADGGLVRRTPDPTWVASATVRERTYMAAPSIAAPQHAAFTGALDRIDRRLAGVENAMRALPAAVRQGSAEGSHSGTLAAGQRKDSVVATDSKWGGLDV